MSFPSPETPSPTNPIWTGDDGGTGGSAGNPPDGVIVLLCFFGAIVLGTLGMVWWLAERRGAPGRRRATPTPIVPATTPVAPTL